MFEIIHTGPLLLRQRLNGLHVGSLPELFDEVEIGLDERPAVGFVLLYDVALEGLTP